MPAEAILEHIFKKFITSNTKTPALMKDGMVLRCPARAGLSWGSKYIKYFLALVLHLFNLSDCGSKVRFACGSGYGEAVLDFFVV